MVSRGKGSGRPGLRTVGEGPSLQLSARTKRRKGKLRQISSAQKFIAPEFVFSSQVFGWKFEGDERSPGSHQREGYCPRVEPQA